MKSGSKTILLAEDDSNDALIFQIAFRRATLPHKLHIVHDGQEAMDWLNGKEDYGDRQKFPRPDVVITDLKMPRKGGFDLLRWMQSEKEFQEILAVVLSSSNDPGDVEKAYQLGAATYFVKSVAFQDVISYLRLL